jgi:hypothetical protein
VAEALDGEDDSTRHHLFDTGVNKGVHSIVA